MEHKKIEVEKLDLPFMEEKANDIFINIGCPSCKEQVSAENIELQSRLAKCSNCNAVFSVKKEIGDLQYNNPFKEKIVRPEGVESFHFRNELEIELDQPYPVLDTILLTLTPFVVMITMLLYFKKGFSFALAIGIVCILLFVKGAVRYANRKKYKTYLTMDKDYIDVQHRPKSLTSDKRYSVANLDQVYVRQTVDGLGLFFVMNGENGQRDEQVLGRVTKTAKLKYIEQEIEQYLKIKDRKVTGEL
jgi:hypothetical protein